MPMIHPNPTAVADICRDTRLMLRQLAVALLSGLGRVDDTLLLFLHASPDVTLFDLRVVLEPEEEATDEDYAASFAMLAVAKAWLKSRGWPIGDIPALLSRTVLSSGLVTLSVPASIKGLEGHEGLYVPSSHQRLEAEATVRELRDLGVDDVTPFLDAAEGSVADMTLYAADDERVDLAAVRIKFFLRKRAATAFT